MEAVANQGTGAGQATTPPQSASKAQPSSQDSQMFAKAAEGAKATQASEPAPGNKINNAQSLQTAIDNAGPGGTVKLEQDINSSQVINLRSGVTLDGQGNTINFTTPPTTSNNPHAAFTPALRVAEPNVTIQNLNIEGNNRNGKNALIQLDNTGDNRANNLHIDNVKLSNATAGVRNRGIIPKNLNIENSSFVNTDKGIDLSRDSALTNNIQTSVAGRQTPDGRTIDHQFAGGLTIKNNSFYVENGQRPMQVGIQVDAGNDGLNPRKAPGFDDVKGRNREDYNNDVTVFSEANITENHGRTRDDAIQASEFGIALSKVENVNVLDNNVETVGSTRDPLDFSSGINVENLSHNINVLDNDIRVNRSVNGQQNNQAISILAFQDHGSTLRSAEASSLVRIDGNNISGSGRSGILGAGFRELFIGNNNFSGFTPKTGEGVARDINLFNLDDNQNGKTDPSEIGTLIPSNGFQGVSTNVKDGGVQELLRDTADRSVLPPDQRQ